MATSLDEEIRRAFVLAKAEMDPIKRYRLVELIIFMIKLKEGLEVPFERAYGGDLGRAERLYLEGNYVDAVRELRKVKADIIRGFRSEAQQGP